MRVIGADLTPPRGLSGLMRGDFVPALELEASFASHQKQGEEAQLA